MFRYTHPLGRLGLPHDYEQLLGSLKTRIRTAQVRAALAVNSELVLLYWSIGNDILGWQRAEGWGTKIVERLAGDLQAEFPGIKGFSLRNLKYMRAFAEAWPETEFVQQVAAQIPWFHNCTLLDKVKAPEQRLWYARATIEHGWNRCEKLVQFFDDFREAPWRFRESRPL